MRLAAWVYVGVGLWVGCGSDPQKHENGVESAPAGAGGIAPAAAGTTGTGGMAGATAVGNMQGTGPLPTSGIGGGGGAGGAGSGGLAAAGSAGTAPAGSGGAAGGAGAAAGGMGGMQAVPTEKFSFFVTSLAGMQKLSTNEQGFGGDLRYGQATGLAGADKICTDLAEASMPGAGAKGWRAFLSTAAGGANDGPVHARGRIGSGPWYDRNARLVAMNIEDLIQERPVGADSAIVDDLPNENGIPNQKDADESANDNHDTVTGSNAMGMFDNTTTCDDWTSTETPTAGTGGSGGGGRGGMSRSNGPRIGHSWPAQSGMHWISAHRAPGCAPSVSLEQMGAGSGTGIGNGGGYGGIYCFALMP